MSSIWNNKVHLIFVVQKPETFPLKDGENILRGGRAFAVKW